MKILQAIKGKILALVFIITMAVFLPVRPAHAVYLPFGGPIISTTPCTCVYWPGILINIGPPKGGHFFFSVYGFSQLKANYNPTVGSRVLGLALGLAPCLQQAGYACTLTSN